MPTTTSLLADKPPEIPAAGESEPLGTVRSPLAALSFLEEDAAERNAQIYFGGGVMGAHAGLEQLAARRRAGPGVARRAIRT